VPLGVVGLMTMIGMGVGSSQTMNTAVAPKRAMLRCRACKRNLRRIAVIQHPEMRHQAFVRTFRPCGLRSRNVARENIECSALRVHAAGGRA